MSSLRFIVTRVLLAPARTFVLALLLGVCGLLQSCGNRAELDSVVGKLQEAAGENCGQVSPEYINANDGCDCPSDGDTTCDPDCADGNQGGDFCGCEYCFGAPPPPPPAYVPPAENAAFGIPGTPPSAPLNALMAPELVGAIQGNGGVTKDGAYTYSIPIQVPAGRAGMTPAVDLNYHSRGGDGPLGVGWSLSTGQSMISRCGKQFASGFRNVSADARVRQSDGIQFTTSDQLCLDGQKLEVVAGTNGVPGSEYRTETATFAKIVAEGGCATCEPDRFKVFHKNGLIGTYSKHGAGASGTNLPAGFYREGGGIVTLLWAQTKLEDRSGNAIEYVWTKENATATGQVQSMPRVVLLEYTTCNTAGGNTCPYGTTRARRITFGYETRPDPRRSYMNGLRVDSLLRLKNIGVYGDNGLVPSLIYTLAYKSSAFTSRSLLESVQQCAPGECLPKTTFTWQDSGKNTWDIKGLQARSWNLVNPGQTDSQGTEPNASEVGFVIFDADGDGNQEVIVKEWPSTAIHSTTGQLLRTSNTMGTGPVDYLLMGDGAGYFKPELPLDLENDGFPQASVRCGASPTQAQLQNEFADLSATAAIDLDMDGREELFAPINRGCPFQWVSTSGGVSTGVRMIPGLTLAPRDVNTLSQRVFKVLNYDRTTRKLTTRATPVPTFNTGFWDTWKYSFADLTGDGLPDVLLGSTSWHDAVTIGRASHIGGDGTAPEIQYVAMGSVAGAYDTKLRYSWQPQDATARTPNVIRVLDENGDGRSELMQLSYDGAQRGFSLNALGTQAVRSYSKGSTNWVQAENLDGTGGPPANVWPEYPSPGTFVSDVMSWRYIDVNGDGLKDAFYARKNATTSKYEWFYRLNTGKPSYLAETAVGHVDTLTSYGGTQQIQVNGTAVKVPQDSGLRIADMNGDGREDLVLLESTTGSIMYSNGTGFDAPVNLPARGSGTIVRLSHPGNVIRWPHTQIADLDGDGLLDLIEFVRDPANGRKRLLLTLRRALPNGHDVITAVTDGLEALPAESVSYKSLSDQSFHASDTIPTMGANGVQVTPPCRYPARCTSSGKAVARYQNFRSSRHIDIQYTYAGARVDVTGRGSLGFRQVKALDSITGVETVDTYEQGALGSIAIDPFHLYPMLQTPKSSVTLQASAGHHLSLNFPDGKRVRTTTSWTPTFATGLPLRITRVQTQTTHADVEPLLSGSSTAVDRVRQDTDAQFDEYGRVTSSTETAQDLGTLDLGATLANVSTTRTGTFSYLPADTDNWQVDLGSGVVVTTTTSDAGCSGLASCSSVTQETTFEYESSARKLLRKITREPNGGASEKLVTILERDGAGLVRRTRLRDAAGKERVSEVDFDAKGLFPKMSRNSGGHVTFFAYNTVLGLLDRVTGPNGTSTSDTYDRLGRLRRTDSSDGSYATFSLSAGTWGSERVHALTVTTSDGGDSKVFVDARGNELLMLTPGFNPAAGGVPSTTTLLFSSHNALGGRGSQQFCRHEEAYASATAATFDSLANAIFGACETISSSRQDIYGRTADAITGDPTKTGTAEGAGEHQLYFYPRIGETRVVDPSSNETRSIADARGNTRRIYEGKSGNSASFVPIDHTYSAAGKLVRVKPKDTPEERFVYDALGRPVTWFMGGTQNTRTWSYTGFGDVQRTTEANELSVVTTYDALGRPLTRTEENHASAAERTITYEWDRSPRRNASCVPVTGGGFTLGAMSAATVVGGHRTSYAYDSQDRICSTREGFADDNDPALWLGFGYDSVGRMNLIRYPATPADPGGLQVRYEFASNGQLRKIVNLTAEPDVDLWQVTDRHPLGMLKQAVNQSNLTSTWQYQSNLLRLKQHDPVAGASQKLAYQENGLLKSRTFNTNAQVETYGYGSIAQRLTDYTRAAPAGTPQVDADYTYSPGGDIKTLVTNTAAAPDLGPVGTQVFGYGAGDPLGGGTGAGYADLLTSIDPSTVGASGTISYGYDSAGRQTSKFVGGVRKRTIASYNTFNLPTRIDLTNGGTVLSQTVLAYDALGNRVSKKKDTLATDEEESVLYVGKLFEAQDFLNRRTNPPTEVRRSLFRVFAEHGPVAEILHNADSSKQTQFLYMDEQGSVNYRTEGSQSVAVDGAGGPGGFRGYNPFGKRWSVASSATMFSSIGYTGHVHDDDLGLINMNGRLYDVEQHRFISRDPMMMPYTLGGTNAYSYVLNNPTNLTDPTGFCPVGYDELGPGGSCIPIEGDNVGPGGGWGPGQGSDADPNFSCPAGQYVVDVRPDINTGVLRAVCSPAVQPNDPSDADYVPAEKPGPPVLTNPPPPPPGRHIPTLGPIGSVGNDPIVFGDAWTPDPNPNQSSDGDEQAEEESSSVGAVIAEALAWLGGWEGSQQYVQNGGFNYGASGQFAIQLNAWANSTLFTLAANSGAASTVDIATGVGGLLKGGAKALLTNSMRTAMIAEASAAGRGGASAVGRALQSHAQRRITAFTSAGGNAAKNTAIGRAFLERLLNNPANRVVHSIHPEHGRVISVREADGLGALFRSDGSFIGLLERFRPR